MAGVLLPLLGSAGTPAAAATVMPSATDGGVLATTPKIPELSRDCGLSAKLSDGNELWVFCDSFYTSNTGATHAVLYNTAAFASPWTPTTMLDQTYDFYGESILNADAAQPGGRDFVTLPNDGMGFPCSGGIRKAWPRGLTALPGKGPGGADRVLVYYARLCDQTSTNGALSYVHNGIGLAEYDYVAGQFNPAVTPTQPLVATTVLNDTLFDASAPWGSGAMASADLAYVHVYRCDSSACYAGRVPQTQAATASSYQWWNGVSWGTTAAAMTMPGDSIPMAQFTVQWVAQIASYVMVYTPCAISCTIPLTDRLVIRTSRNPQGPWSMPSPIGLPNCTSDTSLTPCNAAAGHAEISGTTLSVSYARRNEGLSLPDRLHSATVPFAAFNPLALDADVASFTNKTTATFTFGVAGSTSYTYECSRDAATFVACSSPLTWTNFSSGAHAITVRSVDQTGHRSYPQTRRWTVDAAAPTASVTAPAPFAASPITTLDSTFTFTGTDNVTGSTDLRFECALDAATYQPCYSPLALRDLAPTSHALSVRSVDRAGNRSAAATTTWTITYGITSNPPPGAVLGGTFSHLFTSNVPTGSTATYAVTAGSLPPGLALATSGALTGVPSAAGTFGPITVTATSSWGTAPQTFTIAVNPSIVGTLRNQFDGTPVAGIRVQVFNSTGLILSTVYSGTDGVYRVGALPTDGYRLSFFDPAARFTTQYWKGAASLGTATVLSVVAGQQATADAALEPLTTIVGHVTDRLTGAALPNVWVTLYDGNGTGVQLASTTSDGAYRFPALRPAGYRLGFNESSGAHLAGYWRDATTLATATTITATGGTVVADATLAPYAVIAGAVTDRVSGAALANIRVGLYNAAGTAIAISTTAPDGTYRFATLLPDTYELAFTDTTGGHVIEYWSGATTLGGATPIAATGGVFVANEAMEPLTALIGTVTDARTGAVLSGIWVTLYDANGAAIGLAITAADGTYRYSSLRQANYRIGFKDPNGAHVAQWWKNAATLASATAIVAAGGTLTASAAL